MKSLLRHLATPWRRSTCAPVTRAGAQAEILLVDSKGPAVTALKKQLHAWYEKNSPGEWEKLKISDNDVFRAGLDKAVRRFQAGRR
jgi:peptidoglycan hydrolase-like protein with peptidoglycan-binding domain